MSSVYSAFSQRNTNVTQVIPEVIGSNLDIANISNAWVYAVPIKGAHLNKGNYFVDLAGSNSAGQSINFEGTFNSLINSNGYYLNTALFVPIIDTNAAVYPGLEFTLTFRNIQVGFDFPYLPTIGIVAPYFLSNPVPPLPYIMSAPFPPTMAPRLNPNVTFKSDGETFEVVSSGPAGWMGVPALAGILGLYSNFSPG